MAGPNDPIVPGMGGGGILGGTGAVPQSEPKGFWDKLGAGIQSPEGQQLLVGLMQILGSTMGGKYGGFFGQGVGQGYQQYQNQQNIQQEQQRRNTATNAQISQGQERNRISRARLEADEAAREQRRQELKANAEQTANDKRRTRGEQYVRNRITKADQGLTYEKFQSTSLGDSLSKDEFDSIVADEMSKESTSAAESERKAAGESRSATEFAQSQIRTSLTGNPEAPLDPKLVAQAGGESIAEGIRAELRQKQTPQAPKSMTSAALEAFVTQNKRLPTLQELPGIAKIVNPQAPQGPTSSQRDFEFFVNKRMETLGETREQAQKVMLENELRSQATGLTYPQAFSKANSLLFGSGSRLSFMPEFEDPNKRFELVNDMAQRILREATEGQTGGDDYKEKLINAALDMAPEDAEKAIRDLVSSGDLTQEEAEAVINELNQRRSNAPGN